MAIVLKYKGSKLDKGMDSLSEKMGAAVLMYAATKASELKAKMQANRRWTDRTGMAKARLDAKVSRPKTNIIRITLSHGVSYGIWLELAHEKKYAIIAPTINQEAPRVIEDLDNLLSGIRL